jgi:hypothetical protein
MDELTRSHYELTYKATFLEVKGAAFQDFFSKIMEKRYPGDFIPVRSWGAAGDRKNDGILPSKRMLFQCYAPNELTAAAAISKIDEDFDGALAHWRKDFDTWVFVHNSRPGLGPDVTKKLLDLCSAHKGVELIQWGYEELRREVLRLDEADLASLFGPAPSRRTMMNLGLEDLAPVLDTIARLPPVVEADILPVPADKLFYNSLSGSVAVLLKAGMQRAPLVRKYFRRSPREQDRLAASFREEYKRLRGHSGDPDEIFRALQEFAGGARTPLPTRNEAVLACLAFFFEECDIFDRPIGGDAP